MQFRRNVYEYSTKKLRPHFRMQSEREQTLVVLWLWFTRYIGGRPKFDFKTMPNKNLH